MSSRAKEAIAATTSVSRAKKPAGAPPPPTFYFVEWVMDEDDEGWVCLCVLNVIFAV